jgi:hypothetical protein
VDQRDVLLKAPLLQFGVSAVTATASLALTQDLISNRTEKLISGLASIWFPILYLVLVMVMHVSQARVTAARINAGQPTTPRLTP